MCIFCKIVDKTIPATVLYEDESVIAILDISQTTKGHTLVISKQHFTDIESIDEDTLAHLIKVVRKLSIKIKTKMGASGINILNNNGVAAGQSVDHLHFHIIPRYDENDGFICSFTAHTEDLQAIADQILNKKR